MAFILLSVQVLDFLVFCDVLNDLDNFLVPLSIVGFDGFHEVLKFFVIGHISGEFVVSFKIGVYLLGYLALFEEGSIEGEVAFMLVLVSIVFF